MANQIALRFTYRQRRGRPGGARILVTNVNHFGGRIADRVVGPGCNPVLVAVERPGITRTGFGNHESKVRIVGDQVGPRCGGPLTLTQHHDVLAPAMRKAAQSVKEGKLRRFRRELGINLRGRPRLKSRRQAFFDRPPHELIFQRTSLANDYDPRH